MPLPSRARSRFSSIAAACSASVGAAVKEKVASLEAEIGGALDTRGDEDMQRVESLHGEFGVVA